MNAHILNIINFITQLIKMTIMLRIIESIINKYSIYIKNKPYNIKLKNIIDGRRAFILVIMYISFKLLNDIINIFVKN